jgi:hypothetical protein
MLFQASCLPKSLWEGRGKEEGKRNKEKKEEGKTNS